MASTSELNLLRIHGPAVERIFGGWCSDDGFCYFGRGMVGLGRDTFSRAVADPDALADAPEVQCLLARPRELSNDDWPEWEFLDCVAKEAYGFLAGVDDCGDAFCVAVVAEQGDVPPEAAGPGDSPHLPTTVLARITVGMVRF
ncbi:DUF4240 domain-containing protein [Streptomyces geranii]|uniref:DUF4240 domain-containing protein n=1 Tax=Streptomyces geranii TaxID=2058923 RepID=UPI0038CD3590